MKKVAAVICNYNKKDYVTECIQSVTESVFRDFDIIVVDNASTDGSPECIRARFGEQVKLLENGENLGGAADLTVEYAMRWNRDTNISGAWIMMCW